jgi:hypothetical protein
MVGTTLGFVQVFSPSITAISIIYAGNSIFFALKESNEYSIASYVICCGLPLLFTLVIVLWSIFSTKEGFVDTDFPEWA